MGPPVSGDAGVDRDGAEAEPAEFDRAKADGLHEAGEGRRREEALHRLRQVRIGLAVATDERAHARHDVDANLYAARASRAAAASSGKKRSRIRSA